MIDFRAVDWMSLVKDLIFDTIISGDWAALIADT
jgi:hypothetical protein